MLTWLTLFANSFHLYIEYVGFTPNFAPNAIWSMRSLRHLYLSKRPFKDTDDLEKDSFQLDNLESFVSYRCCSEEEFKWQLRMMPNVRKLAVRLNYCIKLSNFLNRLESLTLLMGNLKLSATEFHLPPTLRKLTLRGSILSASIVSAIGNLPNLEVLKLLTSLEDKTWDVEDNEFLNLKYLKLARSDIEEWNVSPNAFPNLQQLIFKQCYFLTEIPVRFGTLLTLKVIKVFNSSNLADSVHEIIAEQQELGDTNLQIITDFSDSEVDC